MPNSQDDIFCILVQLGGIIKLFEKAFAVFKPQNKNRYTQKTVHPSIRLEPRFYTFFHKFFRKFFKSFFILLFFSDDLSR